MEFGSRLLAFWGILGCLAWTINYFKLFRKAEIYLPKKYYIGSASLLRALVFALGITAWVVITIALMSPREPAGFVKGKTEANDIFFVVDVSRSMLAEDFQPNRLEAAKKKILEFVNLRPTDRIGIIMFSEKAFTLLPLSTDLNLVRQIISEIKVGFLGMGTNIGDALGLAVGRGAQSLAKNKVIILLTDGVSNVGNMTPLQAAEEARDQKIKVYTIGIGNRKNARVLRSGVGGRGNYQMIPGGSVDVKTLEKIAEITGAKSFFAENSSALKEVLDEIQNLEKIEIESSSRVIYNERYLDFLIVGVILLMLAELSRRYVTREAW